MYANRVSIILPFSLNLRCGDGDERDEDLSGGDERRWQFKQQCFVFMGFSCLLTRRRMEEKVRNTHNFWMH
jgi:hypothetical protein